MTVADLRAQADEVHARAWDEVERLSLRVMELEDERDKLKAMLTDQAANARRHIALRDQQLQQAAADVDELEKREAFLTAKCEHLHGKLSRYQALMGALQKEAEYGTPPFDRADRAELSQEVRPVERPLQELN